MRFAERLPLVHATNRAGRAAGLGEILRSLRIIGSEGDCERMLGLGPTAYFFVGSPSLPSCGAIFIANREVAAPSATFTRFDTGALAGGRVIDSGGMPIPIETRKSFFEDRRRLMGDLIGDLDDYLSTHFERPHDYVSLPQTHTLASHPDLPRWAPDVDRRSWTVEVQVPGAAPLGHELDHVLALIVEFPDSLFALDDDSVVRKTISPVGPDDDIYARARTWILEHVDGAR